MRTSYLLFLSLAALPAFSQCPFVPTITPESVMFYCPDDEAELSTQAYDSYQWFQNEEAIPGATAQTLLVDQADAGSRFTVEATLDGCTDTSVFVLVDAWMGLLPFLVHGGDEPYQVDGTGSRFCQGDTLLLVIGGPYLPLTWTNGGVTLPNETNDTLIVTTNGSYSATVAMGVCPEVTMGVGVDVAVTFTANAQAVIVEDDGQLCAQPLGISYTWYLDDEELTGATTPCITPVGAGAYTVLVDQSGPCEMPSAPFIATGVEEPEASFFSVWPVPANDRVSISWPMGSTPRGAWQVLDMTGRTVRQGRFTDVGRLDLDVRALTIGRYVFTAVVDDALRRVPLEVLH